MRLHLNADRMSTEHGLASKFDLAIVGGGVIGLSIAAQCARSGWKVCVIDRGAIGKESSWAGAGILPAGAIGPVEDPIEQLRQLSDQVHQEWARWLYDLTQIDTEYRRCGGLYIARSPAERATMRANCMWWDELGIEYERWSLDEITSRIAMLDPKVLGAQAGKAGGAVEGGAVDAYWVQRDAQVRNPRHLGALKAACEILGVYLIEQAQNLNFQVQGTSIQNILYDQFQSGTSSRIRIEADRVCVATGAWTGPLLNTLGIETGIYPVRGQMQLYRFDRPPFACVVNEGHRYMVPRQDGRLLVGSCEEEVGFCKGTTQEMMDQLASWASSLCPMIQHVPLETQWSGLRPGSIDGFPYLGTLHPYTNGYVAAGHFRHGLHWSSATAVLMDQHMRGHKPLIDLEPFRLHRGNVP